MLIIRLNRPLAWLLASILFASAAVAAFTLHRVGPVSADTAPPVGINIRGIYDVGIFTPKVQELGAFYDKLGFRRAIDTDKIIVYSMPQQDLAIVKSNETPSGTVAVGVFVDDLDSVKANLQKQGIPFEGPKPLEAYLVGIKIKDPKGNEVHFLLPRQ
jgi:hypothetical protein